MCPDSISLNRSLTKAVKTLKNCYVPGTVNGKLPLALSEQKPGAKARTYAPVIFLIEQSAPLLLYSVLIPN